jgi:hypothetical protein
VQNTPVSLQIPYGRNNRGPQDCPAVQKALTIPKSNPHFRDATADAGAFAGDVKKD